jgi:guanylate kinase
MSFNKRGKLWIVAAASGTGKTRLVNALLAQKPSLRLSISHTTRTPRANEVDGRDYHFINLDQFNSMVEERAFLEHAMVFGNGYGTSKAAVNSELDSGHDVLLEIDWQGARQVRQHLPDVSDIFILPPSKAALSQRLHGRGTDTEEVIQRRLSESVVELSHWHEFKYGIINDQFDQALADLIAIVSGDGQAFLSQRPELKAFSQTLLAD